MSPKLPLKLATGDDHDRVLALIAEYYAYDEISFDVGRIAKGLEVLLRGPGFGRIFKIQRGSEVAGYIILTFGFDLEYGGRMATVTDFYLRPQFRHQGLGSQALNALFDFSAHLDLRAIQLQPERDNAEARAFYTKMGFTPEDRVPMTKRLP